MNVSNLLASTVFSAPIKLNTKLGPRLLKKASMTKLSWEIFFKDPKFFKANFEELGIKLQHLWPSNRGAELWW